MTKRYREIESLARKSAEISDPKLDKVLKIALSATSQMSQHRSLATEEIPQDMRVSFSYIQKLRKELGVEL